MSIIDAGVGKKRKAEAAVTERPAEKPLSKKVKGDKKVVKQDAKLGNVSSSPEPVAPSASGALPSPAVVPKRDEASYRKEHAITVSNLGSAPPGLYLTFEETPFPASLKKALSAAGFKVPSPIQAQAWPLALSGRDILATAKTGSGKTCGYLLPSIVNVLNKNPALAQQTQQPQGQPMRRPAPGQGKGTPSIIVMSPTRELALQIQEQAAVFGKAAGLRSVAVYGGAPKGPQIRELHSGAQIVIATPGRLNDLLLFKCADGSTPLVLSSVVMLVLDEADRMCDMGFEDDIKKIVQKMPSDKQTLFFTATWPKTVARVAASLLRNPIQVAIGSVDELRANKDITQKVIITEQRSKQELLMKLVKEVVTPGSRSIIFANKKYICDELENTLWEAGYNVAAIHGDKDQHQREWAINQMKGGSLPLLVATDVAARGLDIKGMDRVINYDFPLSVEDYVHRIGRTGRAGAHGDAHTFFTHSDAKHAGELVKIMKEAGQEVPSELSALVGGGRGGSYGNKWSGGGNKGYGGNKGGRGGGGRRY